MHAVRSGATPGRPVRPSGPHANGHYVSPKEGGDLRSDAMAVRVMAPPSRLQPTAASGSLVCRTGPGALDVFDRNGADLVLLDLMLPGPPGTEVCRSLRKRSNVPVIMLTAKD